MYFYYPNGDIGKINGTITRPTCCKNSCGINSRLVNSNLFEHFNENSTNIFNMKGNVDLHGRIEATKFCFKNDGETFCLNNDFLKANSTLLKKSETENTYGKSSGEKTMHGDDPNNFTNATTDKKINITGLLWGKIVKPDFYGYTMKSFKTEKGLLSDMFSNSSYLILIRDLTKSIKTNGFTYNMRPSSLAEGDDIYVHAIGHIAVPENGKYKFHFNNEPFVSLYLNNVGVMKHFRKKPSKPRKATPADKKFGFDPQEEYYDGYVSVDEYLDLKKGVFIPYQYLIKAKSTDPVFPHLHYSMFANKEDENYKELRTVKEVPPKWYYRINSEPDDLITIMNPFDEFTDNDEYRTNSIMYPELASLNPLSFTFILKIRFINKDENYFPIITWEDHKDAKVPQLGIYYDENIKESPKLTVGFNSMDKAQWGVIPIVGNTKYMTVMISVKDKIVTMYLDGKMSSTSALNEGLKIKSDSWINFAPTHIQKMQFGATVKPIKAPHITYKILNCAVLKMHINNDNHAKKIYDQIEQTLEYSPNLATNFG